MLSAWHSHSGVTKENRLMSRGKSRQVPSVTSRAQLPHSRHLLREEVRDANSNQPNTR